MKIELDEKQANLLQRVLEYYVSELRMEIADTDRAAFRDDLKDEEEVLKALIEQLKSA